MWDAHTGNTLIRNVMILYGIASAFHANEHFNVVVLFEIMTMFIDLNYLLLSYDIV